MSKFHDEFFNKGSPEHDKLMIKCLSQKGIIKIVDAMDLENGVPRYRRCVDMKTGRPSTTLGLVKTTILDHETEHIIRNGTFVMGYVDAVINVLATFDEMDGDRRMVDQIHSIFSIFVEAKPKITSIGDTIRQLKTYKQTASMDGMHCMIDGRPNSIDDVKMCVATYDHPSDDEIEFFSNEKIRIVSFDQS